MPSFISWLCFSTRLYGWLQCNLAITVVIIICDEEDGYLERMTLTFSCISFPSWLSSMQEKSEKEITWLKKLIDDADSEGQDWMWKYHELAKVWWHCENYV